MSNNPIGIFDSGIGGTSIFKEIHALLPNENYIYLADSKNAPYGNKSEEEKEVANYSAAMAMGGQQALAFDEQELKRVFVLVKKLVYKLANRRSRRYTHSPYWLIIEFSHQNMYLYQLRWP